MIKEEYITRLDNIRNLLCEKFGAFLYFIASDVINVSHMEKVVEAMGYTTERKQFQNTYTIYSDLHFNGKLIGRIDNQGLPNIELYK